MNQEILQEMKKLDSEYIEKKYNLLRQHILSQLDYWKKIPKEYYIYEGRRGYNNDTFLQKYKMYRLTNNTTPWPIFIYCNTGELFYYSYDRESFYPIDTEYEAIKNLIRSFFNSFSDLNAETIYNNYQTAIKESEHTQLGGGISPDTWIKQAIFYDIDITYNDYKRHYNSLFKITKKEFEKRKDECIVKTVKEKLLNMVPSNNG